AIKKKKPKVRKQDQAKFHVEVPKLNFKPHYLFTVGSPIGAVLVMRNLEWEDFHPPDDIIHHNLFHPFDPLGYRIEPLIDPVFARIPATLMTSYTTSQSLFPSISLPSLPSLLPGSISTFWENKVPALPRPSMPTLSDLSQMTQSLKAGRWLSVSGGILGTEGTGVAGGAEGGGTTESSGEESTPTTRSEQGERHTDHEGEYSTSSASSVSDEHDEIAASDEEHVRRKDRLQQQEEDESAFVGDAVASVTECMAAVTVATYLDQKERSRRVAFAGTHSDTTTKRPSLGPQRVSSRVDHDDKTDGSTGEAKPLSGVTEEVVSGGEGEGPGCQVKCCSRIDAESQQKRDEPDGDHDASVSERCKDREANTSSNSGSSNSGSSSATDDNKDEQRQRTVHVEGRATKVPYRIDYVLQESTADQYTNEYLLSMRSHFRYWGNRDVAYHILKTMLDPKDSSTEDATLDLKLDMPAPITASKAAKDFAAQSRASSLGRSDQDIKKQNRRSFAFSFFGNYDSSSPDSHSHHQQGYKEEQEIDSDIETMDEEGELFGYRYSDIDTNNSVNMGFSTIGTSKSRITQSVSYVNIESKYETRSTRVIKKQNNTYKDGGTLSSSTSEVAEVASAEGTTALTPAAVPELAKPAKLHHRPSWVEGALK
ncbi:S23-interacting protein, partial [Modicella reniformis]